MSELEFEHALEYVIDDPALFSDAFIGFDDYTDKFGVRRNGPYDYQQAFWEALAPHNPAMCIPAYTDTCDGSPHKRMVLLWGRQCLARGTLVFSKDGSIDKIENVGFSTGARECFHVRTNRGKEIVASKEHLFLTSKGFVHLQYLRAGDYVKVGSGVFGTISLSDDIVKVLGYLCDGYFGDSFKFTNLNMQLIEEFEACVKRAFNITPTRYVKGLGYDVLCTTPSHATGKNPLRNFVHTTGWTGRFPTIISQLPKPSVALFINRLFACDGYAHTKKDGKVELGIGKQDEFLIRSLQMLLFKFDIHGHISKEPNMFRLRISDWESVTNFIREIGAPFGKLWTIKIPKRNIGWRLRDAEKIRSIESVGIIETWDREVLPEQSHVANGFVVHNSGKTTSVADAVIWYAFTHPGTIRNPTQTLITSVGINTSMVMATRTEIWFANNSRIAVRALGHTGATARGLASHLIIVDEAAYVKEDIFTGVLFPQLAATNGSLVLLSTPFGKDHVFYRCFTNRNYWVKVIRSRDCPKTTNAFLEEAYALDPIKYRQEYDVEFLDEATAWFPTRLLRDRITSDFSLVPEFEIVAGTRRYDDVPYFLGGDFGKRGSHTAVVLFAEVRQPDGTVRYKLAHEKQFPLVGAKDEENDIYQQAIAYIAACNQRFFVVRGCLDSTNNESITEQLARSYPAMEGINLSEPRVRDIMTFARNRCERGEVMIPYNSPIINEMSAQQYDLRPGGAMHFPKPKIGTNDRLWATILALYATRSPPVQGSVSKI